MSAFSKAMDNLNAAYAAVEKAFAVLNLGVPAEVVIDSDKEQKLAYKKTDNGWHLVVIQGTKNPTCVRMESVNAEIRVKASAHLEELHAALLESSDAKTLAAEAAAKVVEAFANKLSAGQEE